MDAGRKRREESLSALRKSIQDRATKLEAMKRQVASDRAAVKETLEGHALREAKLKEAEAQARKEDADLERRKKQLERIKEGLKKIR